MNIELKKEKVSVGKCLYDLSAEQGIDLEINLPDYCSDIKRILRCLIIPGVSSVQVTGDRVSAKGEIVVRLIYVGENEKIDCYEQSVDLSKFVDLKNVPENPVLCVKAVTEYVNCRAASQRRFVVGGSVSVNFKIYGCHEMQIAAGCENGTLETKCRDIEAICQSVVGEKTFDISETVAIEESRKDIGRIIRADPIAVVQSAKIISGKILIKGTLSVDVLYCADTKDNSFEHFVHSMPISQIIEIADMDDSFQTNISLDVRCIEVCAKADASGANRLLEIASKVSAFVKGTKQGTISVVTDCYCTQNECVAEYGNFEFLKTEAVLDKTKNVTCIADVTGQSIKSIIDVRLLSDTSSYTVNEDKLEVKASAAFAILFTDSKDGLQYAERNADFDFVCELPGKYGKVICEPMLDVGKVSYAVSGSDKVELKFDASVLGDVYSCTMEHILEKVEADESKVKNNGDAALTVYYCSKGEELWDIAKKYSTEKKLIMEENGLDSDIVKEDCMLMISHT